MGAEAAFLAGYAAALVLASAGVEVLGRRPTDPWASRMLAAGRPPDGSRPVDPPAWPHSEVAAFHLGVSAVILAAALVLTAVNAARNHGPVELAVQAILLAVTVGRARHLLVRYRATARPLS